MRRPASMIIGRILSTPFVFALLVISHSIFVIKRTINWCRYGGGMVLHDKDELKSIQDIYNVLKEKTQL